MDNFTWSRVEALYVPTKDEIVVMYKEIYGNTALVTLIPKASSKGVNANMTAEELVQHVREHYAEMVVDKIIAMEVC